MKSKYRVSIGCGVYQKAVNTAWRLKLFKDVFMSKQNYPEPTVGALIIGPDGKLFLMKSHKWKGLYVMPGGHIELGESIKEALVREVKEETNLDIYNAVFLCYQEFIYGESFWKKRHYIFFDFACKTDTTEVALNNEAQEYTWVALENTFQMPIEFSTRNAIGEYKKRFTA